MVTNLNKPRMAGKKNPTCCKEVFVCAYNMLLILVEWQISVLCFLIYTPFSFMLCFHKNCDHISANSEKGQTSPG